MFATSKVTGIRIVESKTPKKEITVAEFIPYIKTATEALQAMKESFACVPKELHKDDAERLEFEMYRFAKYLGEFLEED